ncbi:Uu.00g052720.m01.CDS01 [Anthostomella pinea]|uniref:Uu.00g052720.m01.CDS01 n=1 Tax=Anthostomella pinea TaxID=933095 RepID=A0AAI8YM25_9PEZI|nr:Uu.00g052720.m01.CDS01 [Anthostomella pinea]
MAKCSRDPCKCRYSPYKTLRRVDDGDDEQGGLVDMMAKCSEERFEDLRREGGAWMSGETIQVRPEEPTVLKNSRTMKLVIGPLDVVIIVAAKTETCSVQLPLIGVVITVSIRIVVLLPIACIEAVLRRSLRFLGEVVYIVETGRGWNDGVTFVGGFIQYATAICVIQDSRRSLSCPRRQRRQPSECPPRVTLATLVACADYEEPRAFIILNKVLKCPASEDGAGARCVLQLQS